MIDLNQVRWITITYANYQGLKAVPLGLLLTLVSLWANAGTGPRRDFLFPGACIVVALLLYWLVSQFYERHYGTVRPTASQRRSQVLRGVIGGLAGLAAFMADITFGLPVSFIGLLFALASLSEGWWLVRQASGRMPAMNILVAVILGILSLLPLLGVTWGQMIGFRSRLVAVTAVAGVVFVVTGIYEHIRLTRWLSRPQEVNHGQRI